MIVIHFMVEKANGLKSSNPSGNVLEMMQSFGTSDNTGKTFGAACDEIVGSNDGKTYHLGSGEAWATTCSKCKESPLWIAVPDTGPYKKTKLNADRPTNQDDADEGGHPIGENT